MPDGGNPKRIGEDGRNCTIDDEAENSTVGGVQPEKNLKERLYDHIKIPLWLLDVIIALLVAALLYILIFKRA